MPTSRFYFVIGKGASKRPRRQVRLTVAPWVSAFVVIISGQHQNSFAILLIKQTGYKDSICLPACGVAFAQHVHRRPGDRTMERSVVVWHDGGIQLI